MKKCLKQSKKNFKGGGRPFLEEKNPDLFLTKQFLKDELSSLDYIHGHQCL